MSGFLEQTPTLRVVLENPLLKRRFPQEGEAVAVMDTGYEGFLSIPREIFHALGLDTRTAERRTLSMADGSRVDATFNYATLRIPEIDTVTDGLYETFPGLEEIIMGTDAISRFRILLDYCSGRLQMEQCH